MYFVYILKSGRDNGYYIGLTGDCLSRLEYHNKGLVRSTKNRIPFKLIYQEQFSTRKEAREGGEIFKKLQGS